VIAKNTLMLLALKRVGKTLVNGESLKPYIKENSAFFFTNGNGFRAAQYFEKNKVPALAKTGQTAPKDILVTKRNTGVAPGNFIQELNNVGLPTKIERSTIAIPEDTVVLRQGERVSKSLAGILLKLNITPFEVGLNLKATLTEGALLTGEDLLKDYPSLLATLHHQALNVAAKIGYITEVSAPIVLGTAQANAYALARVILQADSNALPPALANLVNAAATAAPVASAPAAGQKAPQQQQEEKEEEVDEAELGLDSLFG
jgi:large subunit ribosomal protein L10